LGILSRGEDLFTPLVKELEKKEEEKKDISSLVGTSPDPGFGQQ
jgi:hypothetical protein